MDAQAQDKKVNAMIGEYLEDYKSMHRIEVEQHKHKKHEKNKWRQQKHREKIYAAEVAHGIRSPRGAKHRLGWWLQSSVSLEEISGMLEPLITELSHPYRMFKKKQHLAKKHP